MAVTWTKEMREKAQATKKANREKRKPPISEGKPILYYTGNEECGFDFWPSVRKALRPLHAYDLCRKIEKEIVDPAWWKNVGIIKQRLNVYFILKNEHP